MNTKNTTVKVEERERRVIALIAKLNDTELFGIECYLAGSRAGAKQVEKQVQYMPKVVPETTTV